MPIPDLQCKKCGSPLRHGMTKTSRNWVCSDWSCITIRSIAQHESDIWNEILPIFRLHYLDEELSDILLEKLWRKFNPPFIGPLHEGDGHDL